MTTAIATARALGIALIAALVALAQPSEEIPSAFREIRPKGRAADTLRAMHKRRRSAGIDMRLFDRDAAKAFQQAGRSAAPSRRAVRMNLFPDVNPVVNWTKAAPVENSENIVWTGVVEGDPLSQVVLVVGGGEMTGNIVTGGVTYQIRPTEDGHWIGELDPASLPPEGEPLRAAEGSSLGMAPMAEDAAAADEGAVIDVMVIYTPAARQAGGGAGRMLQQIQLAVAETNEGFANSRMSQRLRLVGYGEVNYRESGDFQVDLDRLGGNGDGYLDEIHAIRDRVGADLVSLWVETGNYCGLGWILNPSRPNTQLGFNVVMRHCATSEFVFGHELGHNMGATHAPEDPNSGGAYPYSFGFKQVVRAPYFRTIMAYACTGGLVCPRVNLWSSPDLSWQGLPAGTRAKNDNRSTLIKTASLVASFRKSTQTGGTQGGGGDSLPESAHPYADKFDQTWSYTASGNPASIQVTFTPETWVEPGWDFISIMDGSGREIAGSPFTGDQLSNKYVIVPGAAVKIRLVSDEGVNGYGFKVASVRAITGGNVDLATVSFGASDRGTIGGTIKGLVAKVQNIGQAEAGPFRIAFYWIDGNSEAVYSGWSCAVNSLGPGLSYTCSGDIGVANTLKPGQYRLVAIADDERKTADSNWDNNARASEGGVVTLQ